MERKTENASLVLEDKSELGPMRDLMTRSDPGPKTLASLGRSSFTIKRQEGSSRRREGSDSKQEDGGRSLITLLRLHSDFDYSSPSASEAARRLPKLFDCTAHRQRSRSIVFGISPVIELGGTPTMIICDENTGIANLACVTFPGLGQKCWSRRRPGLEAEARVTEPQVRH